MKLENLDFTDFGYSYLSGDVWHDQFIDNSSRFVRTGLPKLTENSNINGDNLQSYYSSLIENDKTLADNASVFIDINSANNDIFARKIHSDLTDEVINAVSTESYYGNIPKGIGDVATIPIATEPSVLAMTEDVYNSFETNSGRLYKAKPYWSKSSPFQYKFGTFNTTEINFPKDKVKIGHIDIPATNSTELVQIVGTGLIESNQNSLSGNDRLDYNTYHRTYALYYGDKKVQIIDVPYELYNTIPLNINFYMVGSKENPILNDDLYLTVENVVKTEYKWTGNTVNSSDYKVLKRYKRVKNGDDITYYDDETEVSADYLIEDNDVLISNSANTYSVTWHSLTDTNSISQEMDTLSVSLNDISKVLTGVDQSGNYWSADISCKYGESYGYTYLYGGEYFDSVPEINMYYISSTNVDPVGIYGSNYYLNSSVNYQISTIATRTSYDKRLFNNCYYVKSRDIAYYDDREPSICYLELRQLNQVVGSGVSDYIYTDITDSAYYQVGGKLTVLSDLIAKLKYL
jgi:hypothetical protein